MKVKWEYDIPNIWKKQICSKPPTKYDMGIMKSRNIIWETWDKHITIYQKEIIKWDMTWGKKNKKKKQSRITME